MPGILQRMLIPNHRNTGTGSLREASRSTMRNPAFMNRDIFISNGKA